MTGPAVIGVLDTETTRTEVENARVVSGAFVTLDAAGEVLETRRWLVDPGVPIPQEMPPTKALTAIRSWLTLWADTGLPLSVMHAPYDLTVLDREFRRHLNRPLVIAWPVIDPLVLSRALDDEKGMKHKLPDIVTRAGLIWEGREHDAAADAIMTGRVALRLIPRIYAQARTNPAFANRELTPADVSAWSIAWRRQQQDSLRAYWQGKRDRRWEDVDGSWPLIPWVETDRPAVLTYQNPLEPAL
jgi:DNA polymerase-3 subunit epsilon